MNIRRNINITLSVLSIFERMIKMLNQVFNEDCLEGMKRIPAGSVDMILCDLPYGTTQNQWDSIIPLQPLWEQYKRIIKPNGAIVLTAQTPFDKVLGCSNLDWLKYEWIWEKENSTGFLNANKMPLKNHENVLVFYKSLPTYNAQMEKGKYYTTKKKSNSTNYGKDVEGYNGITENDGERFPKTIQKFTRDKEQIHPTQKPVALFAYLIRTYTNTGETVLDNCMGSCTTAIACMETGRNYIGFEKDADIYKTGMARIEEYGNQATLFCL